MELSFGDKISYGLGGFGKNIAYGVVASYTLYYYNSVLGISASFVAMLLMVARIFDAFNDPLMGVVVAKTRSKYGRYKPWILTGALTNAIIMYAMFTVPHALSGTGLKMYVTITYFLCGITYTLSDIPYWSIIPAITRHGKGRESLTVLARTFSGIGAALPTIITMTLVTFFGRGETREAYRLGFSRLVLVISVLYAVTTIITFLHLPNGELSEPQDSSVKELLGALVTNDQAMNLAVIIICFNAAIQMTLNLALYMFQYDIGDPGLYSVFMMIIGAMQLLAMTIIYPIARKRFNNRSIFFSACLVAVLGYVIVTGIIFVHKLTIWSLLIPGICISYANGIGYVQTTIFVAGAIDYGEAQSGKRNDSIISSLQTLMIKFSSALAVFVAGTGIDAVGLKVHALEQTIMTLKAMRCLFAVPPLCFMVIAMLMFYRKKSIGLDV